MTNDRDPFDPSQRWGVAFQPAQEVRDVLGRALYLGEDAVAVVADEPAQAKAGRQGVHERAEADSLHDPLNPDRGPY
jgi:hypothetical protein